MTIEIRKHASRALLIAALLLCPGAAFGQGVPYHDIALSSSGRPLGGVSVSVCTPGLPTTSAAVTASIATLTFASNPQTAGFVVGANLSVSGFTGNDLYFNGTFTVAQTSSSTISYVLNHANGTATSNGAALQTGNAATPCAPLASIFSDVALTQAITQPFQTDGLGNWSFFAASGPYTAVLAGAAITLKIVPIQLASGSPFSTQIVSTVPTGTAPFSIASTTVVPNLNAQLHNGLTAPASAIVGISDTQTLTSKTLTAPTITNPTITGGGSWAGSPTLTSPTITSPTVTGGTLDGTGAAHVAAQVSAATNYGTALGSQTIIASLPSTGNVSLLFQLVQVTSGVGCSAATNSVTVNAVTYTAPGGTVETANPSSNMGFTGNGAVDSGSATFGTSAFTNNGIQGVVAKSGTSLSYTTTSTLASTGCTTTPQYAIYAKAIF